MSSLSHHGIKGQRWGVRRFQNADGTRTAAGKKRYSVEAVDVNSSRKEIKKLVKGFSRKDKEFFFGRRYWDDEYDKGSSEDEAYFGVKKRFVIREGKDIVAFIDAQKTSEWDSELNMVIGTKASARGKGYASALAEKMVDWYDSEGYRSHEGLRWQAANENTGSRKIAEKTGFKQIDDDGLFDDEAVYAYSKTGKQELNKLAKEYANKKSVGKEVKDKINSDFKTTRISKLNPTTEIEPYGWVRSNKGESEWSRMKANLVDSYAERWVKKKHSDDLSRYDEAASSYGKARSNYYKKRRAKHTSIGGTMYIEGNALILGDSSYLEHHGIRGQRWGVRRFQNRDGSLTNAGRKRLGYATKSAVQTVGKAFKAGVKVGGNAVKAAKAHHEKAEAKKKEKKKEKASQSRLGVLANKDLFTDDELRALNQRFKVEDELKMASIQKGVEIAKAVGTIASNAATAAKAYEDITGQSLSPIKRQAAELKKQQDAEDRARKIAREDAEEARKVAQEERNVKTYEQELRKATASADKEEFLAKKTKAQADQEILKALKGARDFNNPDDDDDDPPKPPNGGGGNPPGGGSDDGSSWVQKATAGGKNPFEKMIYDNDPEYKAAKDAHDEKVARKERMEYLDKHIAEREQEKQAEKAAKDKALMDMINQSNARTGRGQSTPPKESQPETPEPTKTPRQDSDALFSQKGSLPIDKGRYKNSRAASRAKQFKDDVEEERTKKQDDKAAKAAIDTIIKDYQRQDDTVRNLNPSGYDRQVALSVIKSKAKNTVDKVKHPVDTVAKKISDKAREEKWAKERAKLYEEYQDDREKLGPEFANETYIRAKRQSLQNLGYRGEALEKKLNENPFSKKKKAKHDAFSIQNGVLFIDESVSLSHHGIKGQRWGVRRFQNPDGSLTEKGRKHYEKALAKEKRKQASSDAIRGTLERQHPFAVTGAAVLGAVAAGMSVAATGGASVAMIAAGSAISAAVSAGLTHATYSASEAWEGRGTRMRSKKIAKYENMLKQSDMEEGMYHVENGTLFINAGEPYLEHHGVLGMKWGKHLRAGKGPADAPASAGGGGGEDDEKLKEMAKKAGMSVAEYKQKFASKLGGAGKAIYDAAGGSHKKNAEGWRKMAQEESNAARASEKSSHENSARAASQDRKYGSGGDVYRRAAESDKENAETHRSNAKARSERAASEQAAYEKSLAGRYDKMKADRARKKSARQDKAFSGTSPKEKKRVARKDQYLALPEQKKRSRVYDNKDAETRRARAERLTRDSEIFNRAAEESKRKQNSALNKGNKHEAEVHGKDAQFAQDWAEEGRRGAKDWRTGRRTGKPVLRTDSLDQVKKQHDKTLSGKIDKARHTIQRGKQKVYNAAGRYDEFKEKRKKKKAKHSDDTNAVYTEGTRLVVNSKWG